MRSMSPPTRPADKQAHCCPPGYRLRSNGLRLPSRGPAGDMNATSMRFLSRTPRGAPGYWPGPTLSKLHGSSSTGTTGQVSIRLPDSFPPLVYSYHSRGIGDLGWLPGSVPCRTAALVLLDGGSDSTCPPLQVNPLRSSEAPPPLPAEMEFNHLR